MPERTVYTLGEGLLHAAKLMNVPAKLSIEA